MSRHAVGVMSVVASFTAMSACRSTADPGDLTSSVAVVFGSVTDTAGVGVEGASVRIFPTCDEAFDFDRAAPSGQAVTEKAGAYSATIRSVNLTELDACLSLIATPPPETGLAEKMVSGFPVTLRNETLVPPVDSVRVDVVVVVSTVP